jgi:hypothetical protein
MAIVPVALSTGPWNGKDPETGDVTAPKWSAWIWFEDDCSYQVWSWLGPNHLLEILEDLRYVDGLIPP